MAKKMMLGALALGCIVLTTAVFAADTSGIGGVAARVTESIGNLAKLTTAICYLSGMGFTGWGLLRLKGHKDAPTQVPLSGVFVLLLVGIGLLFLPSLFNTLGATVFGSGMETAGVSGITSF